MLRYLIFASMLASMSACTSNVKRDYSWMLNSDGVSVNTIDVNVVENPSYLSNSVRFHAVISGTINTLSIKEKPSIPIHISTMPVHLEAWGKNKIIVKLTPLNSFLGPNKDRTVPFISEIEFYETVPNWGITEYEIHCGDRSKIVTVEMKK